MESSSPFNPGYYDEAELRSMGFKSVGRNVRVGRANIIIGMENISIGDHVRVDSYCTILAHGEGRLDIGSYVHIGGYCVLIAGGGICLHDFSGLSQGVKIYSKTDDYSGAYLTNPTVPPQYTGVVSGEVVLEKHVIVGSSAVVLPRVVIKEGCAIGAMSLVTKSTHEWGVYFGVPAKRLKNRSRNLLDLEQRLLHSTGEGARV